MAESLDQVNGERTWWEKRKEGQKREKQGRKARKRVEEKEGGRERERRRAFEHEALC